jgi:L-asparaginase/Glu-tRNA(Gln) amidotransferase subunit D
MAEKNILLVFTGGTIGSMANAGTIDTSETARFKLLALFEEHYPDHQQFVFKIIQPLSLLSENVTPLIWTALITAIEAENPKQYDGVIVTHGTDTLSFTAAALSYYFHRLDVPVLLVSSDYPLADSRANGLLNFICALEFIAQLPQSGVFVPYRNQGQAMIVHQGNHLAASLQLSSDFFSVQHKSYLEYTSTFSVLAQNVRPSQPIYDLSPKFSERVVLIRPYPGLDYRTINLDHVDAVLHDLYHSGTACVSPISGSHYSLQEFIKNCQQRNIAVYLAPALKTPDIYQSTQTLIDLGTQVIWNLSIEATYAKLLLAYGNFTSQEKILEFMNADIANEHV